MATISNPYEDEENQTGGTSGQGQTQTTGQGQTTGATSQPGTPNTGSTDASASAAPTLAGSSSQVSATPSGGGTGNGVPNSSPSGTSSGAYTNLQNYMSANKNFAASQGGLAGELTNAVSGYTPNVAAAQTQFNNTIAPAQQQYANANDVVQQAIANPTAAVQNSDLSNQVNLDRTATYGGPTSLMGLTGANNYNNLQSQANNYTGLVNEGQSETGRYNLLNQMFNNPNYTTGQQSLDNLLIQSNPQQLQQLTNQRTNAAAVNNQLSNAQQYASAMGQGLQQQAASTAQNTQNALNNAVGGVNETVQGTINSDQALNNAIAAGLASGSLTKAQAQAAGITASIPSYYGVNAASYFTPQTPTEATVITPQQQAQLAALSQLAGTTNPTPNAALAGTYVPGSGFDNTDFQTALANAQKTYNADYATEVQPAAQPYFTAQAAQNYNTQAAINGLIGMLGSGNNTYSQDVQNLPTFAGQNLTPGQIIQANGTLYDTNADNPGNQNVESAVNNYFSSVGNNAITPTMNSDQINQLMQTVDQINGSGFSNAYMGPESQQIEKEAPALTTAQQAYQNALNALNNQFNYNQGLQVI